MINEPSTSFPSVTACRGLYSCTRSSIGRIELEGSRTPSLGVHCPAGAGEGGGWLDSVGNIPAIPGVIVIDVAAYAPEHPEHHHDLIALSSKFEICSSGKLEASRQPACPPRPLSPSIPSPPLPHHRLRRLHQCTVNPLYFHSIFPIFPLSRNVE